MAIDTTQPTVRTAEDIAELPVEPLGTIPGIGNRVLWQDDTSIAGVMTVAAGHRLGTHAHRVNSHHMWILEGEAVILGEELAPGSYVHIPSGVEHDIDATGTAGCKVYYLYLREAG
jgi:mannose-6-phosphate isomerase-like protein (cupin superfamily)